ncbi:MAG: multiheme c-type cytochrome [Planctomycetota bacterium]
MPNRTRFRTSWFPFLFFCGLTLAVAGCWSSDDAVDPTATEHGNLTGPAAFDQPSTEPALLPEEGSGAEVAVLPISPEAEPPDPTEPTSSPTEGAVSPPVEGEAADRSEPAGDLERQAGLPGDGHELGMNPLRSPGAPPDVRGGEAPSNAGHSEGAVASSGNTSESGKEKSEEAPFDPIKENGPIFTGWPDPKLALVITGRQEGYLEPCGCAGLERMKGGLSRRHSMFEYLRNQRGWPVAAVDVGGLVEGFGPQAELKLQTTINALELMKYNVIALGTTDLRFPGGDLISAGPVDESPFVSANAALFGFDAGLTSQSRIVEAGGMKLGVTSILGRQWQKEIDNPDVELADPEEMLAKLAPALRQECDLVILLAHATKEESIELAGKLPYFDVVVTADGPAEPPDEPDFVDGTKTMLVQVGQKAENAVVLGFYDDPDRPPRYQRVPLDSRFPNSEPMRQLMEVYQDRLKDAGLEGLGIRAEPLPRQDLLGRFVGSEECKSCHEESYQAWKKSGHAKAWETLVELNPPRNFDPECIRCHVVGWHPQNQFPYESGFLSEEQTPHLVDVGCETCHGPGEAHVKAEQGADFELQEKLQKAAVITLEQSRQAVSRAIVDQQHCLNCHDGDNSPDFDFDTYWPKIEHREE